MLTTGSAAAAGLPMQFGDTVNLDVQENPADMVRICMPGGEDYVKVFREG